jgi:peptide/nickel transport system ATP-binding protein
MPPPILTVNNLSIAFPTENGKIQAVEQVSFDLLPREVLSIVGESGSGKSVTSLAIMGLLLPQAQISGEILLQRDAGVINLLTLTPTERRQYRGKIIAMIFQDPMTSLNPVFTCGHQVVEAILLHQPLSREDAQQQAIALFQEVKLPTPEAMMHRYPHQLSGGQIQRVMIAMALSGNPLVLIADEPTTALDVTIQATILELLRELCDRRQMAILLITHDIGVVSKISDRVMVMYRGQVMEMAAAYDLFAHPQHPYTKGLLNCRPRPQQRLNRLPTVADFMQVTTRQDGQLEVIPQPLEQVEQSPRFAPVPSSAQRDRAQALLQQPPLLSVRHLTKAYPIRTGLLGQKTMLNVVDDVSFDVYPGETLGLVGESGCGKSTLSRMLLRLVEPTGGEVQFDGRSLLELKPTEMRQLRRQVQIVFQNPYGSMDARQSIGSMLMEPMIIHGIGVSDSERRQRASSLLERVGLDANALNRMPHEFSGGQQQRICIARTLTCEPRFIICDESVSALDVSVQAQVLNLLKDLQVDFGLTYIFISHDLSVVKFVSDRIMVMNQGKIEEIGFSDKIYNHPTREYTRQLIQAIPDASLNEMQDRQLRRSEQSISEP